MGVFAGLGELQSKAMPPPSRGKLLESLLLPEEEATPISDGPRLGMPWLTGPKVGPHPHPTPPCPNPEGTQETDLVHP